MTGVLAERDRLRRRVEALEAWKAMAQTVMSRAADALEDLRETILDYDVAADRKGSTWDARIRIPVDLALKQAVTLLREGGA